MPRIAGMIFALLVTVSTGMIPSDTDAADFGPAPPEERAFALLDLRDSVAWKGIFFAFFYEWLSPDDAAVETLITAAGKGTMRLDFAMENIVSPYCEMRPDPENCDGPGLPVDWMEDIPQTICMDIPPALRTAHADIVGTADQLCLEPETGLAFPDNWLGGSSWPQLHLQQTVTPSPVRISENTATIDLNITDVIATRLSILSQDGYGPARIGMDLDVLRQRLGPKLDQFIAGDDESCVYLQRDLDPSGLGYLLQDGKLARISLYGDEYDVATSLVRTDRGISLGDTLDDLRAAFDGEVLVEEPHEYLGPLGLYVTWWQDDRHQKGMRFEINEEGLVTAIHAGDETITLLEGCA